MMDVVEATRILRREFGVWGNRLDRFFLARYSLLADKPLKDFGSRLQHRLRQFLVFIYLVPPRVVRRAWLPTLKHSSSAPDARALLIWALGMERDSLRNACLVFASALDGGISAGARRQGVALSGKKARLSGVALSGCCCCACGGRSAG